MKAMKTMKTMTKMTTDGILMKNECGDAIKNRDTSVPVRLGGRIAICGECSCGIREAHCLAARHRIIGRTRFGRKTSPRCPSPVKLQAMRVGVVAHGARKQII